MNEAGIFNQTGVFAPLTLDFPNAEIDQTFVTHTIEVTPTLSVTLRMELQASSAMAGEGSTESDFFSDGNGVSLPVGTPVFNLPPGYTINIPEMNIIDNHVGGPGGGLNPVAAAAKDQPTSVVGDAHGAVRAFTASVTCSG